MTTFNNFYFLKDASAATESAITYNSQCDTLMVQVEGDATAFSFELLGSSDLNSEDYHKITGLSVNFTKLDAITAKGIYTYSIAGLTRFKINLTSITGGNITVFGKMTREG